MKVIKMLSEMIEDKIECSEDYIMKAMEYRDDYPEMSKVLYNISVGEVSDISSLHDCVAKIIEAYRKENGEPPAPMMAVYDYLHRKHIDNLAKVKAMQAMYK